MNGKDLLNGFGHVDDRLIQEAEQKKLKKAPVRLFVPVAAGLAAAAVFSIWTAYQNAPPALPDDLIPPAVSGEAQSGGEREPLYFNEASGRTAGRFSIEGHFWEALTTAQAERLFPKLAEKYPIEGTVNYSHKDGKTSVFSIDTSFQADGGKVKITIAPDEVFKCYVIEGEPVLSEIEGVKIEAGLFTTDQNSRGERNYIYYANFKIGEVAYAVEYSGEKNGREFFTNVVAEIISGGKADLSAVANPTVPELRNDKLTESEAYAEADFGAYLPVIPKGYLFNSAVRFINQEQDFLSASWSRGYDDVSFTVSKRKERDMKRVVSAGEPALYDMSLYPVPWADSMPPDIQETIENPIFKIEDLTLDIVKMRAYVRGEDGGPGGNSVNMRFSVLYGGVLVEVATEGVSPEALFEALSALPRNGSGPDPAYPPS